MPEKKSDLRVQKTRESIRRAYLELLRARPAKEITVTQICRLARINRGTFYLHYQDTQDLLDSLINDLMAELSNILHKYSPQQLNENPFPIIYEAFSHFARHAEILPLLQKNSNSGFMEKMKSMISEMALTEWLPLHGDQKPEDYPYINAFIVSGTIEVFQVWLQSGMNKSADELASLIERLALQGIR